MHQKVNDLQISFLATQSSVIFWQLLCNKLSPPIIEVCGRRENVVFTSLANFVHQIIWGILKKHELKVPPAVWGLKRNVLQTNFPGFFKLFCCFLPWIFFSFGLGVYLWSLCFNVNDWLERQWNNQEVRFSNQHSIQSFEFPTTDDNGVFGICLF